MYRDVCTQTHMYTQVLSAALTEISVLFTQNPSVITQMQICMCATVLPDIHTHAHDVNIAETDRAVTFCLQGALLSAHIHIHRHIEVCQQICPPIYTLALTNASHSGMVQAHTYTQTHKDSVIK